ncbi:N-6 DNA methylase, partial [Patescibacteria group bacterium]|nr:N-6 DNA methylase [Patescibacteria group bacterium]
KKIEELEGLAKKQSIKILDPACGSGSFLINAFDYLNQYFRKINNEKVGNDGSTALRKFRILNENIFGVDLDDQAIEIARLNLLLQAVVPNFKLPLLTEHIRIGNSLIEDKNKTDKAFDWKEEYSEVFERKNPGFDVIIGNPPYIKEFVNRQAFDGLRNSPYYQGKMDLWTLFACKAIDLLRDGGYLGFIAPNNWITNAGASVMRDKILKDGEIVSFIDFGDYKVFGDAGIQTMILIFRKKTPRKKYSIGYTKINDLQIQEVELIKKLGNLEKIEVKPKKYEDETISFVSKNTGSLLDKIQNAGNFILTPKEVAQGIVSPQETVLKSHLSQISNGSIGDGIFVIDSEELKSLGLSKEERKLIKPYYSTNQIERYYSNKKNEKWIIYTKSNINKNISNFSNIKKHLVKYKNIITSSFGPYGLHRARDERFFVGEKIISVRKTDYPKFSYSDFSCYVSQTFFVIKTDRVDLKYLLAILNSNVVFYWLLKKGKRQGKMLQIDKAPLLKIPIKISDKKTQKELILLVDKILELKSKIKGMLKIEKKRIVEEKMKDIECKINSKVYKIYGLNREEVKTVENACSD